MTKSERPDNQWRNFRFALGMAQMAGATLSAVLLVSTGVTTSALLAVTVTCAVTSMSVFFFGAQRPGKVPEGSRRSSTNP